MKVTIGNQQESIYKQRTCLGTESMAFERIGRYWKSKKFSLCKALAPQHIFLTGAYILQNTYRRNMQIEKPENLYHREGIEKLPLIIQKNKNYP